MSLTYNEIEYILDIKYIVPDYKSFSFPHGIYQVREINNILNSILPENVKNVILASDITMKIIMSIHTNNTELLKFDNFFSYNNRFYKS